jgi:hypothetical protein
VDVFIVAGGSRARPLGLSRKNSRSFFLSLRAKESF